MEFVYEGVNEQFSGMFDMFRIHGKEVQTRNGRALRITEPVLTQIYNPQERVLFHAKRDANPIFHLYEALWMLSGSNEVLPLKMFNSRIHQYSDDGVVFNGAYGYRMRHHFGVDQLLSVIDILKNNPESRQAVVQLWDADDLNKNTLDKCCNTQLVFEVNDGKLNMTTFNRSNDAWWGYAGANAVHFTVIMEFVAGAVGVDLGMYSTVSTNLHLYLDLYDAERYLDKAPDTSGDEFYSSYSICVPDNILDGTTPELFLEDCRKLMNPAGSYDDVRSPFLVNTMIPMMKVAYARKNGETGYDQLRMIQAEDWHDATSLYIKNRETAKNAKAK